MNGFPWLTVAGAVPLVGAIVVALIPGLPADSAEADRRARNALAKYLALAFSLLTNMAAGLSDESLSHAHTLAQAQAASVGASRLLADVIAAIAL